jgi:pectate lyase
MAGTGSTTGGVGGTAAGAAGQASSGSPQGGTGQGGSAGSTAGKAGSSGASAGAAGGSGGSTNPCANWPTAKGSQTVSATIDVSGTYDGQFKRFVGSGDLGGDGQEEDQPPIFDLANGATLKNVILGAPAADGVHCAGACTLENVWWEDVGEDAATFRGSSSSQRMTVRCGGAKQATDKVFQHNGAGTVVIENFQVDGFGKLYRSCGNCSSQYERHVTMNNITARNGLALAGVNTNYDDSAEFSNITIYGDVAICQRWTGNDSGDEPTMTGTGPDSTYCLYETSDVTQR